MSVAAYVGIGANLGDPVGQVRGALDALTALGLARASSLYRTEPLGDPGQPWYVNAVAELRTELSPADLLARLQALEARAGRPAERAPLSPRLLDLDLLLFGDLSSDDPGLVLPHAGLARRRFVLEPLAPFLLWVRGIGKWWALALISMHVMLELLTNVSWWQWMMVPLLLVFLPPKWLCAILRAPVRWTSRD